MKNAVNKPRGINDLRIGTAGWTIPKQHALLFPVEGSHLERYAQGLNCVEINSSFYRPHMLKTWRRWAESAPPEFKFAVKMPKAITHEAKLVNVGALLLGFLEQVNGLGEKLGPLLIQLPPKLAFDEGVAHEFFTTLRELHGSDAVFEPRHASWFTPSVDRLLRGFEIARVAADPAKGSTLAAKPGGWQGLRYYRLHGTPRTYYSNYSGAFLEGFAASLREETPVSAKEIWVVFDNTALGHATANAVELARLVRTESGF
jgi:uncharacterized protein YecE (DUF72 family)